MTVREVIKGFGFNPQDVGVRHRGWWMIENPDETDLQIGAEKGFLCVKARDGASNFMDDTVDKIKNYVGTIEDSFDCTYIYYYFKPLKCKEKP